MALRVAAQTLTGPVVYLARWPWSEPIPHDTVVIDAWIQKNTAGQYGWVVRSYPEDEDPHLHNQRLGVRFSDLHDAVAFKIRWC